MASEDSQGLGWLAVIHGLSDLRDLDDSLHREMSLEIHQFDDPLELHEVLSLRSSQRMLPKERNDRIAKVAEPLHAIPEEVFSMIVVAPVAKHLPASEESDQF